MSNTCRTASIGLTLHGMELFTAISESTKQPKARLALMGAELFRRATDEQKRELIVWADGLRNRPKKD